MHPGKLLVIGLTTTTIIVSSCAKKQNDPSNISQIPTNGTSAQTSTSKAAESEDIFNEFYKDENSPNQKEKMTSKETFTPSGTSGTSTRSTAKANSDYEPQFSEKGRYVIQISTVKSQSFAEELKGKLEKAGYPAYVAEVQNPVPSLSGTFYRIRIGAFSTFRSAKDFGENVLKSIGYDYWIDNKANDLVGIDGNSLGNSGSSYGNYSSPSNSSASDNWVTNAPSATPSSKAATTPNIKVSEQKTASTESPKPVSSPSASPAVQPSSTPAPAVTPAPAATATPSNNGSNTTTNSTQTTTSPADNSTKEGSSGWGSSGW